MTTHLTINTAYTVLRRSSNLYSLCLIGDTISFSSDNDALHEFKELYFSLRDLMIIAHLRSFLFRITTILKEDLNDASFRIEFVHAWRFDISNTFQYWMCPLNCLELPTSVFPSTLYRLRPSRFCFNYHRLRSTAKRRNVRGGCALCSPADRSRADIECCRMKQWQYVNPCSCLAMVPFDQSLHSNPFCQLQEEVPAEPSWLGYYGALHSRETSQDNVYRLSSAITDCSTAKVP